MNENKERESFEAWIRGCEGHPFAGQFANLMWKAWQARAVLAQPAADAGRPIDTDASDEHAPRAEDAGAPYDADAWRIE